MPTVWHVSCGCEIPEYEEYQKTRPKSIVFNGGDILWCDPCPDCKIEIKYTRVKIK